MELSCRVESSGAGSGKIVPCFSNPRLNAIGRGFHINNVWFLNIAIFAILNTQKSMKQFHKFLLSFMLLAVSLTVGYVPTQADPIIMENNKNIEVIVVGMPVEAYVTAYAYLHGTRIADELIIVVDSKIEKPDYQENDVMVHSIPFHARPNIEELMYPVVFENVEIPPVPINEHYSYKLSSAGIKNKPLGKSSIPYHNKLC